MSNIVRMLKACVIVFLTEAKHLFQVKNGQLQVQFSIAGSARELNCLISSYNWLQNNVPGRFSGNLLFLPLLLECCVEIILNCSCFCHIINILITKLSRSVWKNLDLGLVYLRPWSRFSHTDILLS